jgi:hypothetical protein
MKKTVQFLVALFGLTTSLCFSQNDNVITTVKDDYTRTNIEYLNGQPTLAQINGLFLKYNFEKIVKKVNDKKVTEYNLVLFRSAAGADIKPLTKIHQSPNKAIYVTVVFDDYTIVNARPTLESDGYFKDQITIPVYDAKRFATKMIKSIVVKHTDETDRNDIVLDHSTNTQFIGAKQLMTDVNRIVNFK